MLALNIWHNITDHFIAVNKMVVLGAGTGHQTGDFILTRYACY